MGRSANNVSAMGKIRSSRSRNTSKGEVAARKGRPTKMLDVDLAESVVGRAGPVRTFGELAASANGVYAGPPDLSTREGFRR